MARSRIPVFVAAVALLLALPWAGAQAAGCDGAGVARAVDAVHQARIVLLALPVGDGMETSVSPRARAAIAVMKTRLGDFVAAFLRCRPGDSTSYTGAMSRLLDMPARGEGKYGATLEFTVRQPFPKLLVVTAAFAIECGTDTMLLVFTPSDTGWREVLRLQSKPYDTAAGAYDMFDYAVSPPDAAGHWFLVQKNITPWCSSTWATIRYSVLRPSADALKPRVLLDASDSIWWGNEDFGRLSVAAQDFTLRFHAESIDGGVHNREWLRRFAILGDTARRIPPLAASPRDFADEWIVSDWSVIAPWTAKAQLRALHDRLKAVGGFDYVSIRRCAASGRTQIEVEESRGQAHYYFLIAADADMRMLDVTGAPNRTCTGPNQFKM